MALAEVMDSSGVRGHLPAAIASLSKRVTRSTRCGNEGFFRACDKLPR